MFVVISFVDMENDRGGLSLLEIDVLDRWHHFIEAMEVVLQDLDANQKVK
jgi:hypothetical protein